MSKYPTINLKFYDDSNVDKVQALAIRITYKRNSKYRELFKIAPKFFDYKKQRIKRKHKDHQTLNGIIEDEILKLNQRVSDLLKSEREFIINDIFKDQEDTSLFLSHIKKHVCSLDKIDKWKSARKYQNLYDKVLSFDSQVKIAKINKKWFDDFLYFLNNIETIKSKQTTQRYLKYAKTILNNAFRENYKIDHSALKYPVSIPKSIKTKLSAQELLQISKLADPKLELSRDIFLLQFFLRGARIGDIIILHQSQILNNRVVLNERKTGKKRSIIIIPQTKTILDKYWGDSKFGYLMPLMDIDKKYIKERSYQKKIESKTSKVNRDLKLIAAKCGIEKKLSTHVARHTFAFTCLKKGMPLNSISELLGHDNVTVTEPYLRSLSNEDELDDAASEVYKEFIWE